ncbi:MAG: ABC transporter permease [Planctomycetes bacterium]|nr:ABC transporter permease [Planctomycetota bacterium]
MDVFLLIRRYLRTRRIALVAALFVAIAVAAMILITSVMDGFRHRIHTKVRGVEPDLTFRMKKPPRDHFEQVAEMLAGQMDKKGGVIAALAPRLVSVGFLFSRVEQARGPVEYRKGVEILGVDWERTWDVIPLERIIGDCKNPFMKFQGELSETRDVFREEAVPGVLVGEALAKNLRLTTLPKMFSEHPDGGATVNIGFTNDVTNVTGRLVPVPGPEEAWRVDGANLGCRVAGVFDSGRDDFDGVHIIMDRWELHSLRYGDGSDRPDCTTVHAKVIPEERARIDEIKAELAARFPQLEVESWKDRTRGLMDALDVEKRTMALVLGFIVVLAICLIFGLLYMMVVEKTRDVGVLRSMGFSGRRVIALFVAYGTMLGLLGSAVGAALGVWLVQDLNWVMEKLGIEVFNPAVPYRFHTIPTILDPGQVMFICGGTVVMAMIAGAVAALKASVIDPVRCLRYE